MTFLDKALITLENDGILKPETIRLSASKSESNRVLVINALSGNPGVLENLSDARDTVTMKRLLDSGDVDWDVLDAGTTMRFLTAFLAVTTRQKKVITGSTRMKERPIKILVEALVALGADIRYIGEPGYPPLEINAFKGQTTSALDIPSNISSQYISALLMIAPSLPDGLRLNLIGEVYSAPYIRMTLALMEKFGASSQWEGNSITVPHQPYEGGHYRVESDWSGASYWYGMVALARQSELELHGLRSESYQGDQKIVELMAQLGVNTEYVQEGVALSKTDSRSSQEIDFRHCPDLAQTIMVAAAANRVTLDMTGLESLKIKETDRIAALQTELRKVNVDLVEIDAHHWKLESEDFKIEPGTTFATYDDHRMAMALAPLGLLAPIQIENPGVVAKSYPGFWDDLKKVGFVIS